MQDTLVHFLSESKELLNDASIILLSLKDEPNNHKHSEALYRYLHTLKGACGFFDLDELANLIHASETELTYFRERQAKNSAYNLLALETSIAKIRAALSDIEEFHENGTDSALQLKYSASKNDNSFEAIENSTQQYSESHKTPDVRITTKSGGSLEIQLINALEAPLVPLTQAQKQLAQIAVADSNASLLPIIDSLADITKQIRNELTNANQRPIADTWSDLQHLIRNIVKSIDKSVCLTTIPIELHVSKKSLTLIKGALTQIIKNSCDHGIESPEERTACGKPKTGLISIRPYIENEELIIEVEDDGRGLDPTLLRREIEKKCQMPISSLNELTNEQILSFVFTNGITTVQQPNRISGRGVGMDIVRSNIEQLGGMVDIKSTLGLGTIVTLRLSQELCQSTQSNNEQPNQSGADFASQILLIGKNEYFENILTPLLNRAGYSIALASGVEEAISLREQGCHFGLMLVEIELPEKNGLVAARQIRQDQEWSTTPIIALSSEPYSLQYEPDAKSNIDIFLYKSDFCKLLAALDSTTSLLSNSMSQATLQR